MLSRKEVLQRDPEKKNMGFHRPRIPVLYLGWRHVQLGDTCAISHSAIGHFAGPRTADANLPAASAEIADSLLMLGKAWWSTSFNETMIGATDVFRRRRLHRGIGWPGIITNFNVCTLELWCGIRRVFVLSKT